MDHFNHRVQARARLRRAKSCVVGERAYDRRRMSEAAGDDWITAPAAARLLGLTLNSVYNMIDRGALEAEQGARTVWKRNGQVCTRRHVRIRRGAVDEFLERARVKPGSLSHMLTQRKAPPELELAMIKRLCRTLIADSKRDERRAEVTIRGHLVTLWELHPLSRTPPDEWRRARIAQLRHDATSGAWSLYWPYGRDKWHPWTGPNGSERRCTTFSRSSNATRSGSSLVQRKRTGVWQTALAVLAMAALGAVLMFVFRALRLALILHESG